MNGNRVGSGSSLTSAAKFNKGFEMHQVKGKTSKIVEKIAGIMSRHDLNLEDLTNFISENSQPIINQVDRDT